ncbi:hypothetical protein MSP7336_04367 [Mycobacterium shimoidei]|uniref:Uncharacterized protein n=1 Tax=Mycobacterium shimoidei TaxID=29313 RepID=A0A375Z4R0_MYCSH|nr:hypothetical protein [Mycobacterium shimoidei]SRX96092.1 hypothetical protein MSP7336_04367 [Mycobacterium shimoidei]
MKILNMAAAIAIAAVTLTSCTTDPAPKSAAPSSATVAAPALAPQKIGVDDLPAWVDIVGARDAAASGQPFVFPERDEGGQVSACRTYMRMPDGAVWILNHPDTAPVGGTAFSPRRDLLGCGDRGFGLDSWETRRDAFAIAAAVPAPTSPRPEGVPDLSSLSTAVDQTAAQRAMRAGLPFMFAAPSGGVTACHSAVLMPDGNVWVLNETGPVPIGGAPLDRTVKEYGCSARGGVR